MQFFLALSLTADAADEVIAAAPVQSQLPSQPRDASFSQLWSLPLSATATRNGATVQRADAIVASFAAAVLTVT